MREGTTSTLGKLVAPRSQMVQPSRHRDTLFKLYSIPAYDTGAPELVLGKDIGSAKQAVQPGDVLLSRIVPHIRRAWVVEDNDGRHSIASNEWIVFRHPDVDARYLSHFLVGDWFHARFMNTVAGVGGSLLRAKSSLVAEIDIPLPPLAEQRRIAALLDRADAVRRRRAESRRLVDELLRSVFLEMFGDPVRNEKGWEVVAARQIVADTQYGMATKANTDGRGITVLRMNNITYSGQIDLGELKSVELAERDRAKFTVRRGDLLFNRTNSPELVGKTAVWDRDDEFAFAGYLVRVRLNGRLALPEYVSAVLNSESGKAMLRSVAKPSINMSNISASGFRRLRIPLPPLALQERFQKAERQVRTRLAVSFQVAEGLSERLSSVLQEGSLTDPKGSSLGE